MKHHSIIDQALAMRIAGKPEQAHALRSRAFSEARPAHIRAASSVGQAARLIEQAMSEARADGAQPDETSALTEAMAAVHHASEMLAEAEYAKSVALLPL